MNGSLAAPIEKGGTATVVSTLGYISISSISSVLGGRSLERSGPATHHIRFPRTGERSQGWGERRLESREPQMPDSGRVI